MKEVEKIAQLQEVIREKLTPIINHDYWLLEVPYYKNIGDCLIWQGELDFLATLPYKCKGMRSYFSKFSNSIAKDDIILLQGGGNFGDIWPKPQDYRMRVIRQYPNNKVIILPQTVWFEHEANLKDCAKELANYPNLTICARDKESYRILKENFKNDILLLPDMAFYIDMSQWKKTANPQGSLLMKREDPELKMTEQISALESKHGMTIADWPTFKSRAWQEAWLGRIKRHLFFVPGFYDWYALTIYRPYLINAGVQFISSYEMIYSTRLHAAILSVLLGKASDLVWFDNSYGKNRTFYETWLKDCDGIQFVENK